MAVGAELFEVSRLLVDGGLFGQFSCCCSVEVLIWADEATGEGPGVAKRRYGASDEEDS